jgi:NAD(P)-dependent dehydrogenase (short-subunit alcohol dehydrogenase family)
MSDAFIKRHENNDRAVKQGLLDHIVPVPMASTVAANLYNGLFCVAGKNVLITGGSRGIGFMIAQGYVAAGANVVLTSRDENACREAISVIQKQQQQQEQNANNHVASAQYVTSSLSTREGCEELASKVGQIFHGKLDILINNAGTSWGEPLEQNSKTDWGFDKVLALNVKAIFYLTRACLPLLRRDQDSQPVPSHDGQATIPLHSNQTSADPSRIINIGSITGIIPQEAPTYAYDISKAAVHHLTRKLAKEFAPYNITVNCIAPGFVPTRMSSGLKTWGGSTEALSKHIPLQRMGNADDMVGACVYLSSRAGSWCTGVILNVDGGTVGAMQIPLSSL